MDAQARYPQVASGHTGNPVTVVGKAVAHAWPWVSGTPLAMITKHESPSESPPMSEHCLRCGKDIQVPMLLAHAKAEEYFIELIKGDHPEWVQPDGTCPRCTLYYRVLAKRTGV